MADKTNDVLLACSVGDVLLLRRGLLEGTDLHSTNREGLTGLHVAAKAGHHDCLEHLLTHGGIDVNHAAKKNQLTPLHCALLVKNKNSLKCMDSLIQEGAEISSKDEHGSTALHYAAKSGQIECIELLLENGADVHDKDNDDKMAYEIAQLHNQHSCYRLLSSVHWASRKDESDLKQLGTAAAVRRAKRDNDRLCLQLKQERGAKAYSEWLSSKPVLIAKAEPTRCQERKTNRLTTNGSSTCTYCSTIANSRGQSADSSSLKLSPMKITSNQEARNLDFVGKPVKMLPYSNYLNPSQQAQKTRRSKHLGVAEKATKLPSASRTGSGRGHRNKHHAKKPTQIRSNRSGKKKLRAQMPDKTLNKNTKNDITSHTSNVPTKHHLSSDKDCFAKNNRDYVNEGEVDREDAEECEDCNNMYEDYEEEADDENGEDNEIDDDDKSDDDIHLPFHDDEGDTLTYPQFSFNTEDENNFFHEVGPMNDLNSLALPSVLTKGRTPAEVLQVIRHLENSASQLSRPKARRSNSVSGHSSTGYRNRHWNRRFSLGSIPEGEIVYNYGDEFGNEDDDKVDSYVLLNLENLMGSGKGRESDEENDIDDSNNDNNEDQKDVADEDTENTAECSNHESQQSIEGVSDGNSTEINSALPASSTLKIVNLEWDLSTNRVNSEISSTQLLPPPSHRRSCSSSPTDETGQKNPERKITPPSWEKTQPSRKITPPSRKITPPARVGDFPSRPSTAGVQVGSERISSAPSTRYQAQRKRPIASAPPSRISTEERKITPPSRKISPSLCNPEDNLLYSSIQEIQEDSSHISSPVEINGKDIMESNWTLELDYSLVSSSKQRALPKSAQVRVSETSPGADLTPPASFSDPCMANAGPNSPRIITVDSPGQSGPISLQKASFFIGDSDSSDEGEEFKPQHSPFSLSANSLASKSVVMGTCESSPDFESQCYSAPVITSNPVMAGDVTKSEEGDMEEDHRLSSSLPVTVFKNYIGDQSLSPLASKSTVYNS